MLLQFVPVNCLDLRAILTMFTGTNCKSNHPRAITKELLLKVYGGQRHVSPGAARGRKALNAAGVTSEATLGL